MIKRAINLVVSLIFIGFVFLIGIIPFRLLYIFSDFIAFMLGSVFRYRYKVIRNNLAIAGLDRNPHEFRANIKGIYRNLSDILIEGIKSFTMSKKCLLKRYKIINSELLEHFCEKQQSVILVTGHLCNWEWGSLTAGLQMPYRVIAFYKPLSNYYIDIFLRRNRSRFATQLASIKETSLTFEKNATTPTLYLMAADQSPTRVAQAYWNTFMGKETAFLHGPEKHARNNNYPVVFANIRRTKRGHYQTELSLITKNPEKLPEGEITSRYARKLEKVIKARPDTWLWTHRRWKHEPDNKRIN